MRDCVSHWASRKSDMVPTATARDWSAFDWRLIVDPAVVPYLPIWPLPNSGVVPVSCAGGRYVMSGYFKFSGQQVTPENYFTTRIDHKISASDTLYGTYMHDAATISQPDELGVKLTGYTTGRQLVTIEENHIFTPQVVNAARVGYSRVVGLIGQTLKAPNPLAADPSLGFAAPGRPVGEIDVGGLTNFSGGLGAISNYNFHWNSFQGYDDAFVTMGKHSIKFGVAVERIQENMSAADSPNGIYIFDSLPSFLPNNPTTLRGQSRPDRRSAIYPPDNFRSISRRRCASYFRTSRSIWDCATKWLRCRPRYTAGSRRCSNLADSTLHTRGSIFLELLRCATSSPESDFPGIHSRLERPRCAVVSVCLTSFRFPMRLKILTLFAAPFYLLGSAGGLSPGDFPHALPNITPDVSLIRCASTIFSPIPRAIT